MATAADRLAPTNSTNIDSPKECDAVLKVNHQRVADKLYPLVNVYKKLWKDPPFLMGKLTISMAIFNSYVKLPEGMSQKAA